MLEKDEKIEEQENASTSEEELEEEELENTGSSDYEDSSEQDVVEPSDEEENQNDTIDYSTELEKERARLGRKIDKERQKRIDAEKKNFSREEVEELVSEKISGVERKLLRDRVENLIEQRTTSPEEKELALLKYDHAIVKSDNIAEDVENAVALANRKKMQGKISEIKKSLDSKSNRETPSGAGAPQKAKKQQKYSQETIEAAKFAGVTPDEFVKQQEQH